MIGATLGSYRIVSEIGSGGMGVVYLAEHTLIGRKAAVKLLRSDMPGEYVERFFNEAKAAATLHHPGLVDVFDFGHHTDGSAFIVMEYLQGESLADRLAHEPRLPIGIALAIARSVANALHVAHVEGIVHRDLKPGNIFLLTDPEAPAGLRTKVLDFGIAKLARDRDSNTVRTQSGAMIGTPRYMSPEQCKNAKVADDRSDIYALGCILYEMLLGVAPFEYDSWAELVSAHLNEIPARPREIDAKLPPNVETLVCKMIAKRPEDRFASMQDLSQSLEVLLLEQGERVRLTPPSLQRPSRLSRKELSDSLGGDTAMAPAIPATKAALAETGAFADTDMRKPNAPTLAQPAPPRASSTDSSKPITVDGNVATAEAQISTEPVAKPGRTPWAAIGIGAAGLVALSVAGAVAMLKRGRSDNGPAYIVVNQRGSGEAGSATRPVADKPVDVVAPIDAGAAAVEPATTVDAGAGKPTPVRPTVPPTETDVGALTRTFGRQSPAITACFEKHGVPAEQVMIRFQIDTTGTVVGAEVLPASIAPTPLGGCVLAIAKKTAFGTQPKPATFRIPLVKSSR
jgi:serine/threonine-protein kinase